MFLLRSILAICRYGTGDLKAAIARGQYDYPRGIFFGGHGPSGMQKILAHKLPSWLRRARYVVHVDFHTGLGRWGTYRLLLEPEAGHENLEWSRRTFGPEFIEPYGSAGISYPTRGDIGTWCSSLIPGCRYRYLCAEFGTYSPLRVLAALRAENQAHHTLSPGRPAYARETDAQGDVRPGELGVANEDDRRRTRIAGQGERVDVRIQGLTSGASRIKAYPEKKWLISDVLGVTRLSALRPRTVVT